MARFEIFLILAKRKDDDEIYTDNLEYVCFCEGSYNQDAMSKKTSNVIQGEIDESEDEVLFGSANIIIRDKVISAISFKNKDCDPEEIDHLLDLILEDKEEIMH